MGSSQREELVDEAIRKVQTHMGNIENLDDDRSSSQHLLLLSSLISQLESLKSDGKITEPECLPESEAAVDSRRGVAERHSEVEEEPVEEDRGDKGGGIESALVEEVVKELKAVKRQNLVTHCLLSAMILLTVVWQMTEVSLIIKVHDGLSHPFKSFGSMISGFLGGNKMVNLQEPEKQLSFSTNRTGDIVSPVPPLNVPELPRVEWGGLNGNSGSQT